jgi:hypothetical protein
MGLLSSIELPHWLMIAGAVLVVGFFGLAFRKNAEPVENDPKIIQSQPRRLMSQTLSGRTSVELLGEERR